MPSHGWGGEMTMGMMLAFLHNLARHKLYAAINVAGLALGIAVFLTMTLIVRYEYRYDAYLPDTGSVYRADIVWRLPGAAAEEWPVASFFAEPFLKHDFTAVSATLRVWPGTTTIRSANGTNREILTQVDPDFFSFFHLEVVDGDEAHVFSMPEAVAIPASVARKYFGVTHAVGKSLTLLNDGQQHIVSLVYADPPLNTHYSFGIVEMVPPNVLRHRMTLASWHTTPGTLWIRIPNERDVPIVEAGITHYVTRHPSVASAAEARALWGDSGLHLVKMRDIHFHDAQIGWGGVSAQFVTVLGLVGLAALATAIVNYVNLATARAGLRAREVAMRKVMGATRGALIVQFLFEAICLVALAAFVGLALCELSLHWVNMLGGWGVTLAPSFTLPLLGGIIVSVGLLAGLYPAMVLSSFRPAAVLAASRMPSGGRKASTFRQALVVLQFTFAIVLAVCTLVMSEQANFIEHLGRGIRMDGVIVLGSDGTAGREDAALQQLRAVPGVDAVERSDIYPHYVQHEGTYVRPETGSARHVIPGGYVTSGFFDLYGFKLLAGRLFDPAHARDFTVSDAPVASQSDRSNTPPIGQGVVVSALAARQFGFARPADAVGRIIRDPDDPRPLTIIGVVQDVRLSGPHTPDRPLIFFGIRMDGRPDSDIRWQIRYSGASEALEMARLREVWHDIAPNSPIDARSVPDILSEDYRMDRNHSALFAMGSAAAIGIACLGLYGLSAFSVSRREQEIGIRKVLGASLLDIVFLLAAQFLRPIVIANLVAWPIAWGLMRYWLQSFDVRVTLTPMPFVLATIVAGAIATLTITGQTLRAARNPPAVAFRQI